MGQKIAITTKESRRAWNQAKLMLYGCDSRTYYEEVHEVLTYLGFKLDSERQTYFFR